MGRYTEQLAGEADFQWVIAGLTGPMPVKLVPDPENLANPRSIKAITSDGQTVGTLANDSWLVGAMLDEGTPVASRIAEILPPTPATPFKRIVLEVLTGEDAIAALSKVIPSASDAPVPKKWSRLLIGCLAVPTAVIGVGFVGGLLSATMSHKPNRDLQDNAASAISGDGGMGDNQSTAKNDVAPANGPEITAAEFARLEPGMSYDRAVAIVGSQGEIVSDTAMGGYRSVMVKWDGNGFGGNANAIFQNGRLISKAQMGLR